MPQYRSDIKKIDPGQLFTRTDVVGLMEEITPSGNLLDAYGKLRISDHTALFVSQRIGDRQYKFDQKITGNANSYYVAAESSMYLTVGTNSGDEVIRESIQPIPYQPGKSQNILMSFVFNEAKNNLRQRVGYFDGNNGLFFENTNGINYFVIRSSSSGVVQDTKIPQSDWNNDKFDGSGYSSQINPNFIFDCTKANILYIEAGSFSAQNIYFGFVIGGKIYTGHVSNNYNNLDRAFMSTLTLPIRQEITNIGITDSPSTAKQLLCAVSSDGGFDLTGLNQGASRGYAISDALTLSNAGVEYPVFSYRLKSTFRNNIVIPNFFHIYCTTADICSFRVWIGAKATGGTWETNNSENRVEFNRTFTAFTTNNARVIQGGFCLGKESIASDANISNLNYTLGRYLDGSTEEVTLTIIPGTGNLKVLVKCDWIELI